MKRALEWVLTETLEEWASILYIVPVRFQDKTGKRTRRILKHRRLKPVCWCATRKAALQATATMPKSSFGGFKEMFSG